MVLVVDRVMHQRDRDAHLRLFAVEEIAIFVAELEAREEIGPPLTRQQQRLQTAPATDDHELGSGPGMAR